MIARPRANDEGHTDRLSAPASSRMAPITVSKVFHVEKV